MNNKRYDLRIAVIDVHDIDIIPTKVPVDEFLDIAEIHGTVYSLSYFISEVNKGNLDCLTESYIKAVLVNCDDPNDVVEVSKEMLFNITEGEV